MHWLNRIFVAMLVVAAVAWGREPFELAASGDDLDRVTAEVAQMQAANAALAEEVRLVRAEVAGLKRDPAEIGRIAREDLNLVAPGEVVFEVERTTDR